MKITNQRLFDSFSFLVFFFLAFSVSAQLKMGLFLEDKICYLTNEQPAIDIDRVPAISINFGVDANYFFESGVYLASGIGYELTSFRAERVNPSENVKYLDKFSRQSIGIPVEMGYQFYLFNEVISTGVIFRPRVTLVDKGDTQQKDNGRDFVLPFLEYKRESPIPLSLQYYIGMQREVFSSSIVMVQLYVEYDPSRFYISDQLLYTSSIQFGLKMKYIL